MDILDFIPIGSKNARRRKHLRSITGLSDRLLRDAIHKARRKIPILNMQDGRGYFIPDMNDKYDRWLLVKYVRQEERRLKSIGWSLMAARKTLRNCGIDWRNYDEQQKERSERREGAYKSA